MSTDAISILKEDHKAIKSLFTKFERSGEDAKKLKQDLVAQIIELLTIHTYIENEVMYPDVRRLLPDLEGDVLESYEEHHMADVLCSELMAMDAEAERFTAKVTVLIENVRHHMQEEEQDWFPKVREGLGRKQLSEIGQRLLDAKQAAPHSPSQPSALKKNSRRGHQVT